MALLLGVVLVAAGCAERDVRVVDDDVAIVLDVEEALRDAEGFRYRYTHDGPDEYGTGEETRVVVEGERDVTNEESSERRTTTHVAPVDALSTVDDIPERVVVERESVTTRGATFARVLPSSGAPGPWSELGPIVWRDPDPYVDDELARIVGSAMSVDRFEPVADGDTVRRRLRGIGEGTYGDQVTVDVWIVDGLIHRIQTSDDELVEMWDHGVTVSVPVPEPIADVQIDTYAAEALYPLVDGDWEVEADGTVGDQGWTVYRAPGRVGDVEVPCRILAAGPVDDAARWDDPGFTEDEDGPVCGGGGYGGLLALVEDPAAQVLVPSSAWDAGEDEAVPLGLAVSSRFSSEPAVLVGLEGERLEVPLGEGGIGVVALPGGFGVVEIELVGGDVVCTTGLDDEWLEDGYHAAGLLIGIYPTCEAA